MIFSRYIPDTEMSRATLCSPGLSWAPDLLASAFHGVTLQTCATPNPHHVLSAKYILQFSLTTEHPLILKPLELTIYLLLKISFLEYFPVSFLRLLLSSSSTRPAHSVASSLTLFFHRPGRELRPSWVLCKRSVTGLHP